MNRRSFGGALASSALGLGCASVEAQEKTELPWLDPEFAKLPTLDEQVNDLAAKAVEAQTSPRRMDAMPVTGAPVNLGGFDRQLIARMKERGLVGVAVAIAIHGRLVVAKGYGRLSSRQPAPVTPTTPGFLGSITKPLCAMSALTLARDGLLDLDSRVLDILPLQPLLKPGEQRQNEIDQVTVRMLMNHTSGLFNVVEQLYDDAYYTRLAANGQIRLVHGDVSQYDLVRRGMSVPFVAPPGREAHYSGQGLQVLGRIIETVSGQRLDKQILEGLLRPCGVRNHATLSYLSPETRLLINQGDAESVGCMIPSEFDAKAKRCLSWRFRGLDAPYGNQWGGADSCGSSMMSCLDLVRFLCVFPKVIGNKLYRESMQHPRVRNNTFHGLGWGCGRHGDKYQFGHGGAIPGARAFCESTWDGVQYAVLVAGDQDPSVDAINQLVLKLGRVMRDRDNAADLWSAYGYADLK